MRARLLTSYVSLLTAFACAADFPALYNSEPGNPSPMSPQEALKALKLPDGFIPRQISVAVQSRIPIASSSSETYDWAAVQN